LNCTLAQETRIGARKTNQDRLGYWRTGHSMLMVVADGLGGHSHGEIAAQVAVQHFAAAFQRDARPLLVAPDAFLPRCMSGAHAAILREAQRLDLSETPRTVIVACVVQEGYAYWTHVGDCRLYVVRRGSILQRTRDHTVVQQLLDAGRIREEAITTHPDRNRLLQCLGSMHAPRPDTVERVRLKRDDLILLCSDGLWGPLTQRQLLHALVTRDVKQAIPELADLAEVRAGQQCDNVSVLAMAWGEDEVIPTDEPPTIPAEQLPTDVHDFTATDLDFMHMSDEDIEKAIADIKAALRKASQTQR
jgi:serine/threonine protein phosphatase PrpC